MKKPVGSRKTDWVWRQVPSNDITFIITEHGTRTTLPGFFLVELLLDGKWKPDYCYRWPHPKVGHSPEVRKFNTDMVYYMMESEGAIVKSDRKIK